MNPTEEELHQQLRASQDMPYGQARTAVVEQVIRHADALGLADLQYTARVHSLQAYRYGAEPAKTFVPFAWCLAAYDRGEGDRRLDHHLFWNFKGIVSALTAFPEVPLAQTRAVLDDMERRYRLAGHGMNPVHQYRELLARHIGDRETAAEEFRLWNASPRGEMSDCAGCEPSSKIRHLSWFGRDEEAVAAALPVLSGELTCREQPHGINTALLLPYVRTGRLAEAAQAHRSAYRAMQHDRTDLGRIATHLIFCARTGNHPRGLHLLERHLGWLDEPPSPSAEQAFAAAGALVLTRVIEAGHAEQTVRWPAHRDRDAVDWPIGALRDHLAETALGLAARFDARNGTARQSEWVRTVLTAEPLVEHLPLSGPARAAARLAATPPPLPATLPEDPAELAEAAESAYRQDDDETADALWARFDEVCPQPPPVLAIRRRLATVLGCADHNPDQAMRELPELADALAEHGEPVRAETVRSRHALFQCYLDQTEEGLAGLRAAIEALSGLGDAHATFYARYRLAEAHRNAGEADTALALLRELIADSAGHPDRTLVADVAFLHCQTLAQLGPEQGPAMLAEAERALAELHTLPPTGLLGQVLHVAGQLNVQGGELDKGYAQLVEAGAARDPLVRVFARHDAGRLDLDRERYAESHQLLTEAVTEALRLPGRLRQLPLIQVDLAAAALNLGQPEEAADLLEEAMAGTEDQQLLGRARFLLVRAHRALGQPDAALTVLEELIAYFTEIDHPAALQQMHGIAAEVLDELDRDALAAEHHHAAAETLTRIEHPPAQQLFHRRQCAMSWHWAGQRDRALVSLTVADALAATMGEDEDESYARALLDYDAARILSAGEGPEIEQAVARAEAAVAKFSGLADVAEELNACQVLHGRLLGQAGRVAEAEATLTAALHRLPPEAPQREHVQWLLEQLKR